MQRLVARTVCCWLKPAEAGTNSAATYRAQIEAVTPERAVLSISETGYRSHFCSPAVIDGTGGPVAFVLAWLDAESRTPKWKAADMARRQMSLFD